ncbi:MAG: GPW/gp25 family protein [Clostridium sp.]|nr:GPW/gp25 family protein [Acetatifactor muris]MCM1527171.1 GPW/gp25 family protein [Bacteroides sp.]MCM1562504.1 GPW/gp25 family protein [Clostridium sp.]
MSTGWKFPFTISARHGRVELSDARENIRESVEIILLTEPGERLLHPEFGTGLRQFLFENIDDRTVETIQREVRNSLRMWERRIEDVEVSAGPEEGRQGVLRLTVSYRIADTAEYDRVEVTVGSGR